MHIFTPSQVEDMSPERQTEAEGDDVWLWGRYVGLVWDSLGKTAARDLVSMMVLCRRLWDPFVSHIRDGTYGTREFSRLVIKAKDLFRDESVLVEGLIPSTHTGVVNDSGDIMRKTSKGECHYSTQH